jgi:hypothetical protein
VSWEVDPSQDERDLHRLLYQLLGVKSDDVVFNPRDFGERTGGAQVTVSTLEQDSRDLEPLRLDE